MRLLIALIFGMIFCCGPIKAQEDNMATATNALQDVLSNLKQSVEKLSLDNDQWMARDNAMKAHVLQLRAKLEQLEDQGDQLNNAASQLREKNTRHAQEITRLEAINDELDNRTRQSASSIKLIQESMASAYQEDQKLLLRLKGMSTILVPIAKGPSPESLAEDHLEKEKLKLMKMIYDSQQRQESLHEAILDFQKNAPLMPAADAVAHQQLLKEQVKDLSSQLAAFPREKSSANGFFQWDDTQLRQLETELKVLERNYLQLKGLVDEMSIKAQAARMTESQHLEEVKLQGSMDDLKSKGVVLKADLDELRSQMVDLDKRKSHLESMIQHF